jgi:D-3-phosphoglycerate dehydrogenase
MVNATLIADQMGITVDEHKSTQSPSFSNMITLNIEGQGEKRTIAGTLFEGSPRIVKLRDYQVDFAPEEHMLILTYGDRPGMIGKIGTIMGAHDINIASMNLGRREKRGEAMVILSLDSAVPPFVVEEVRKATEAAFIKPIHMPGAKCDRGCGCGI